MNKPPSDQNACPPKDTSGSWSSSITRFPASASSALATSPASPAPTTMTSVSMALPASWLTPAPHAPGSCMVYEGDKMVKGSDSFRVSKTQLKLAEVGHACEQSATAPKPGGSSGDLALPSQF